MLIMLLKLKYICNVMIPYNCITIYYVLYFGILVFNSFIFNGTFCSNPSKLQIWLCFSWRVTWLELILSNSDFIFGFIISMLNNKGNLKTKKINLWFDPHAPITPIIHCQINSYQIKTWCWNSQKPPQYMNFKLIICGQVMLHQKEN
jgi:hypothetical protein